MEMRKKFLFLLVVFCIFSSPFVFADDLFKGREYKDDEVVVIFKDDISNKSIKKIVSSNDASLGEIVDFDDSKIVQATISDNSTLEDAIEDFSSNSKVLYAGPNYKYNFYDTTIIDTKPSYWFDKIDVLGAWNVIGNSSNKTRVAIIDSGVDVYHEDLQANLVDTEKYTITSGGKIITSDSDFESHGTHVAGIIGATYGNGLGSAGVASGFNNDLVEVMVVGTSEEGYLFTSDIVSAISYAVDNGAKVINMSFGGSGRDRVLEASIKDAYSKGTVLVAASGNDATDSFTSPSDFKEVISVNSSNEYDKANYWANYGKYKDVTAPGNNIFSTIPGDIYGRMSGTSMASPVVSAVVALMLDVNPNLTPSEVYNILCGTTGQSGFNYYTAYGIINAKSAVLAAKNIDNGSISSISMKSSREVVPLGDDISLEILTKPVTSREVISWKSSDTSVATVDSNGTVKGVGVGSATITAYTSSASASASVVVKDYGSISNLQFSNTTDVLYVGDEFLLDAWYYSNSLVEPEIYYYSSDNKVASVVDYTSGHYLRANSVGTVTVTVKNHDGSLSDSFTLTVREMPKRVSFSNYTNKLLVGDSYSYDVNVTGSSYKKLPYDAEVVWKSTNPRVASVSDDGVLTAKKVGYTYLVATAKATVDSSKVVSKSIKVYVGYKNYSGSMYGLKAYSEYDSVSLIWNMIYVAENFVIERSTSLNGPFKVISTTSDNDNYYYDDTVKMNTTYYYRIKGNYNSSLAFGYSNVIKIKPTLSKPNLALYNKNGYIRVAYSKIYDADGYFIYRSFNKNSGYKLIKRINSNKILYFNDKNVVKGRTYYYKVAGFKKISGKRYIGTYSNAVGKVYR